MTIKISVVIPCYKVEAYLQRCVDSVLRQTFRDIEIILVDDGSPDQTGVIADELATSDNRVKVIHQSNGGAMKARETGALAAKGEWVTFVDGDDTIPDDALQNLYDGALVTEPELVVGFRTGVKIYHLGQDYQLEDYRRDTIAKDHIHVAPFGRLYRKNLLEQSMFDIPRDILTGEDWLFNIRYAFVMTKRPVVVGKYVYHYMINDQGLHTNKETPEYLIRYDQLRLESIPTGEQRKYFPSIMKARFIPLLDWTFAKMLDISWQENQYVTYLREVIRQNCYTLNLQQKMLLSRHVMLRIFYFNALRISYHFS